MEEQRIYLTTNRLLYNASRVLLRNGKCTKEEMEYRKTLWEREMELPDYEKRFSKKKSWEE